MLATWRLASSFPKCNPCCMFDYFHLCMKYCQFAGCNLDHHCLPNSSVLYSHFFLPKGVVGNWSGVAQSGCRAEGASQRIRRTKTHSRPFCVAFTVIFSSHVFLLTAFKTPQQSNVFRCKWKWTLAETVHTVVPFPLPRLVLFPQR